MRFLSSLIIFLFLISNLIFSITPLHAQQQDSGEGHGGGDPGPDPDPGFGDLGDPGPEPGPGVGPEPGPVGGGGGGGGGGDIGGGGGAGASNGDYGDPGSGDGSDNNDGSNTDGGNGIEGTDESTDDDGNNVTLKFDIKYYCVSGYIKLSWTTMQNRQYRLYKDGIQVPGSPFAENILSYDDHEVTFADKTDIAYSLEYIKVDKGKVTVKDTINLTAVAPCAPPAIPVFTNISDKCVNDLPEVTFVWNKTNFTTYYEVWRSPTGVTSNNDAILLSAPRFAEGSTLDKFTFNDPINSVVVNQAPEQGTIYWYKIVSVGPGYPDGRTPGAWTGLKTKQCIPPTVQIDTLLDFCYTPTEWQKDQPIRALTNKDADISKVQFKLTNITKNTQPLIVDATPLQQDKPSTWEYTFGPLENASQYKLEAQATKSPPDNSLSEWVKANTDFLYQDSADECSTPWIQVGGDVHSNNEIDTPGGP